MPGHTRLPNACCSVSKPIAYINQKRPISRRKEKKGKRKVPENNKRLPRTLKNFQLTNWDMGENAKRKRERRKRGIITKEILPEIRGGRELLKKNSQQFGKRVRSGKWRRTVLVLWTKIQHTEVDPNCIIVRLVSASRERAAQRKTKTL